MDRGSSCQDDLRATKRALSVEQQELPASVGISSSKPEWRDRLEVSKDLCLVEPLWGSGGQTTSTRLSVADQLCEHWRRLYLYHICKTEYLFTQIPDIWVVASSLRLCF